MHHIVDIPVMRDRRGNLAVIERSATVPFIPAVVEWGVPSAPICGPAAIVNINEPTKALLIEPGDSFTPPAEPSIIVSPPAEPEKQKPAIRNSHRTSSVAQCTLADFPEEPSGLYRALLPFDIKRIYYLFSTPATAVRGKHSHYVEECVLVAVRGSFRVRLNDGHRRKTVMLDSPSSGLYIPPGIWREMDCFSPGTICLALSSINYDRADYVRSAFYFNALTARKS